MIISSELTGKQYKSVEECLEDEKNGVVGAFNAGTTAENAKEKTLYSRMICITKNI